MDKVVVTDLVKLFGDFKAVDQISFTIRDNEFFSLLGPSGCGKSTTLRCIAGLEDPDGGTIEIGGRPVYDRDTNIPPNKRLLGMVFQNYAIWPHMTVYENISYPLKIAKKEQSEIKKTVGRVMETLGIGTLGSRKPHALSGGQQQRVALGRSLAMQPDVLLLDEPLSNLDAKLREEMRIELKTIQERTGTPILYVTHDQLEAMAMSDQIAIMKDGRILQCSDPLSIYNKPVNRFVFDFIGQSSYIDCEIIRETPNGLQIAIDGKTAQVPRPPQMPREKSALLAVRPEDIELLPFNDANDEMVTGQVKIFLFLGNLIE
ncbi:MAG: ABC transporter ATP-binding protein, partial [Thermodesulfobacteriota bacterium]